MTEKMLLYLTASFIGLTLLILLAAIFMPGFVESGGATIAGIVVGAYVSLLGGAAVGASVTKAVRRPPDKDNEGES